MEVTSIFPKRLKELRGSKKLTEVSKDLGVTRVTLGYYESGERKPDIEILYKIADYYHVSSDYLLGLSNTKSLDSSVKELSGKTGLSETSINFLMNAVKETSRIPEDNFDTMPALYDIYLKTINLLLEECEPGDDRSILDLLSLYLFSSFTHYYTSKNVEYESLYCLSSELELWDANIGIELPFTKETFSRALLIALQDTLTITRQNIQEHIDFKRITPRGEDNTDDWPIEMLMEQIAFQKVLSKGNANFDKKFLEKMQKSLDKKIKSVQNTDGAE